MKTVFLITPADVRANSVLQTNIDDLYINNAIIQSTEIDLQNIYGTDLYNEVVNQVSTSATTADINILLDESFKFLVNTSVYRSMPAQWVKFTEIGMVQKTTENVQPIDYRTYDKLRQSQQQTCDNYAELLRRFILNNQEKYDIYATKAYDRNAQLNNKKNNGFVFKKRNMATGCCDDGFTRSYPLN